MNGPPKLNVEEMGDLLQRKFETTRNFGQWLNAWQSAIYLGDMLGLLHELQNVDFNSSWGQPEYVPDDRLIFLLRVANGWSENSLLAIRGENDQHYAGYDKYGNRLYSSDAEIRQIVAQKAFAMLCTQLFKLGTPDEGNAVNERSFGSIIYNTNLFFAIKHLFRISGTELSYRSEMPNLPRARSILSIPWTNHHASVARTFLLNLIDKMWDFGTDYTETNYFNNKDGGSTGMMATITVAKPWTIEVLNYLGELHRIRRYARSMDQCGLDKLKTIAMRMNFSHFSHPVNGDRPVACLDEAIYLGSDAALLLLECEIKTKTSRRLEAIERARESAERAQKRLESLTKTS